MDYEIIRLIDKPEIKEQVAQWFHEKWSIPLSAYIKSMDDNLTKRDPVFQWYVAKDGNLLVWCMMKSLI